MLRCDKSASMLSLSTLVAPIRAYCFGSCCPARMPRPAATTRATVLIAGETGAAMAGSLPQPPNCRRLLPLSPRCLFCRQILGCFFFEQRCHAVHSATFDRPGRDLEPGFSRSHVRGDRPAVPPACRPLRRWARRVRDGRLRKRGARVGRGAAQGGGRGARHPCRAAGRSRPGGDGDRRARCRGGGRQHRRHQHGLPGQAGDQRLCRLCADARCRSCAAHHRGDGRGGERPGDAEDAARLGRCQPQCRGHCAQGGSGGRPARHRAWPHALPVLSGRRRLGRHPPREGSRRHSRRRQWRSGAAGRRAGHARRLRRRRGDDRARRLWPAVDRRPDLLPISTVGHRSPHPKATRSSTTCWSISR